MNLWLQTVHLSGIRIIVRSLYGFETTNNFPCLQRGHLRVKMLNNIPGTLFCSAILSRIKEQIRYFRF